MKVIVVAGDRDKAQAHIRSRVEPAGIPSHAVVVVTPQTGLRPARGLRGCIIEYGPGAQDMPARDLRYLALQHPAQ